MENRREQHSENSDANYDHGSSLGKESYQDNLRRQREGVRREDETKAVKPSAPKDPKIKEFIDRLDKKARGEKKEPEQPSLLN
jgi:hypothetical protein